MKTRNGLVFLVVFALLLAGCAAGNPLAGSKWSLETLGGQPRIADTTVTLQFEGGQLSGQDGCNQFGTSYSVNGSRLAIGAEIVSTLMACDEPVMTQADAFISALKNTASFKVTGQQLSLLDAQGAVLATFLKA